MRSLLAEVEDGRRRVCGRGREGDAARAPGDHRCRAARHGRRATSAGGTVRAGTIVVPAIALVQLMPEVYPDPQEFRPERFLGRAARAVHLDPVRGRRAAVPRAPLRAARDPDGAADRRSARATLRAPDPAPERIRLRHVTLVPGRDALVVMDGRRRRRSRAGCRRDVRLSGAAHAVECASAARTCNLPSSQYHRPIRRPTASLGGESAGSGSVHPLPAMPPDGLRRHRVQRRASAVPGARPRCRRARGRCSARSRSTAAARRPPSEGHGSQLAGGQPLSRR